MTAQSESAQLSRSVKWALASLSLSMLLSSLGTSIANVGLPTLAQVFNASFQQVQWVVLAYLLAITTLIVSVGRLGDLSYRSRRGGGVDIARDYPDRRPRRCVSPPPSVAPVLSLGDRDDEGVR